MQDSEADIIVVGAGLAGLSAALTARERGAKVVVLECAPEEERGGNTRFSNGAMRAVYQGLADVSITLEVEAGPLVRADALTDPRWHELIVGDQDHLFPPRG